MHIVRFIKLKLRNLSLFVAGLEYLSAARSLHPELHAGSTLASQDFQLSLDGKMQTLTINTLLKN